MRVVFGVPWCVLPVRGVRKRVGGTCGQHDVDQRLAVDVSRRVDGPHCADREDGGLEQRAPACAGEEVPLPRLEKRLRVQYVKKTDGDQRPQ